MKDGLIGLNFLERQISEKLNNLDFESARAIVRKMKLKSNLEWRNFSKTKRPKNIPGSPDGIYKNKGWISWADFLGKE